MISCIHCQQKHPQPAEAKGSGWTVYYHNNDSTWRWVCPVCQKELDRQEILHKVEGTQEEQEEAWEKIIDQFDKSSGGEDGVLFAGNFYKDEVKEAPITVTVGAYKATDTLQERDIEKLLVQAGYYSGGNIAQFILDVFNKYVDRYEKDQKA